MKMRNPNGYGSVVKLAAKEENLLPFESLLVGIIMESKNINI